MSAMFTGDSDDIHAKCDGPECLKPSIMKCSGCGVVRYCSKECQLNHWKNAANPHRAACKILKGVEKVTCTSLTTSAVPRRDDASRKTRWVKMIEIGGKLFDEGENAKAMQVFQRCLSDFADVEDASCLGLTLLCIAKVCSEQGEYAKAIVFNEKAIRIHLHHLGPTHPDVAIAYCSMGNTYHKQGDYTNALHFHEKALCIQLQSLGPNHVDVGSTYNNMGNVYHLQGNCDKALDFFEKCLRIDQQSLGPNHPHVGNTYSNMGSVCRQQGDYIKALDFFEKGLSIKLQSVGPNHPVVAITYMNMGNLYAQQGENTKALEFHEKALGIQLQNLGTKHPSVGDTYVNMGNLYIQLEDMIKVKQYHEKAQDIYLSVLGENHPKTKTVRAMLEKLKEIDEWVPLLGQNVPEHPGSP